MNKAVPWNVNGVGFDAREAAREAARRQGKSLGEWLHGVIADHAADLGVEEHEIAGQQRIDAVTSKLERLSTRSAEHDRRMRAGRGNDFPTRRPRDRDDDIDERDERPRRGRSFADTDLRRRREGSGVEATELLLEEAIDAMERRALRAERHSDNALQSFTKLLERNEAHRDRERDSVTVLAQKLSEIENRLTERLGAADENPIKGALARLEARLDTIGRRSAAEATAVRQQVTPQPAQPLQRLEDKLNVLIDAIQARGPQPVAEASSIALAASQASHPKERRLGNAIADIANRQQALQGADEGPISLPNAILRRRQPVAMPRRDERPAEPAPFVAMQNEISTLASKIEELRRDVVVGRQSQSSQPPTDFDSLRADVATMSGTLRELTPRGTRLGLEDDLCEIGGKNGTLSRAAEEPRAIAQIQTQMQEIRELLAVTSAKVERAVDVTARRRDLSPAPTAAIGDLGTLETLVRDLSRKIEAVQAPGADHGSFDALQQQVALLSDRFERSNEGLSKLTSLERSMRDLFAHLDETRTSVETSAARTAREVLRIAMEEGRAHTDQGTAASLAAIQALQDEADARTTSTLSAVHGTLEKVVDRLSVMESDMAARKHTAQSDPRAHDSERRDFEQRESQSRDPITSARAQRTEDSRSRDIRSPRNEKPSPASDSFLEQALGFRPGEQAAKAPAAAARGPKTGQTTGLDLEAENGRADFIAAARRAAKVAQTDPALAEMSRPAAQKTSNPVRAGLIEQSRDYVTRHKRPVLLSIAALFVILGTMAIMQRIGLDDGESRTADAAAPIASRVEPAPPQRQARQNEELTPSALPPSAPPLANPIPGSDPIQTGSIPSLPSFAAAAAPRPKPPLSSNLKTLAESGDGAAEYLLGAQYAEGNAVPRDFTMAARWYAKAATQNVAPAQYRLASLYEKGLGVTQDKAKAKALYLQAAEAGNPRAMHNLAVLLADGDGKPDYDGAATWFRKAAQYGIHDSQYNLAILLARGIGVQQSLVQSYQWFAIAAAQGDADAGKKRDEVATKLSANDLAVAKALAGSFRPRIADIAATDVQPPSS